MKKKLIFDFVVKLGYSDFYHTKINGISGVADILCNRLNMEQKEYINTFNNTKIGLRIYKQAPELKQDILFLGNKNF